MILQFYDLKKGQFWHLQIAECLTQCNFSLGHLRHFYSIEKTKALKVYFDELFFTFQHLNFMHPFGIGIFFEHLEVLMCVYGGNLLLPNPNSNMGDSKMTMELVEWLPTAWASESIALHSSIFAKSFGIPGSCSSRWVTGNYLYKKEAVGHNVVQPWSHWKMLASFALRVVESECESWLSSLDSPFSNFHRSHLAFICSPGSLIINQTGAAFKHILRQPACTNRTKLSNLSAWLLTMISFALHNPFLHTLPPKGCCFGRITVQNRRFIAKMPST